MAGPEFLATAVASTADFAEVVAPAELFAVAEHEEHSEAVAAVGLVPVGGVADVGMTLVGRPAKKRRFQGSDIDRRCRALVAQCHPKVPH